MNKRRRRSNPWVVILLILLVTGAIYFNEKVVPTITPLGVPTVTPTRSPESFLAEAEGYEAQGKYALAIQAYQQLLIVDPRNPANYLAIARLQIYTTKYEAAATNSANAMLLAQNNPQAYALQGFAYGMTGEDDKAEEALNKAIELDPNFAAAYAFKAIVLANASINDEQSFGTLDDAITASQTARDLAPDSLETHWARGIVLEATGNYQEAITDLEAAVVINPYIADLYMMLGRNYRFIPDNEKAREEFNRANSLNPTDPLPDYYISRSYASDGEYAKAIQYAEQAVMDTPDDPFMHGNLAVMYYRNLQYEDAMQEFRLAIEGGAITQDIVVTGMTLDYGRVAEYYYTYGLTLSRLGYCTEALPIANAILQNLRNDDVAIYNGQEILNTCQELMDSGAFTPTPLSTYFPDFYRDLMGNQTSTPSPTPEITQTPEP